MAISMEKLTSELGRNIEINDLPVVGWTNETEYIYRLGVNININAWFQQNNGREELTPKITAEINNIKGITLYDNLFNIDLSGAGVDKFVQPISSSYFEIFEVLPGETFEIKNISYIVSGGSDGQKMIFKNIKVHVLGIREL